MGFIEYPSQRSNSASIRASDGLSIPSIQVASWTSGSDASPGQRDI
jgi:hypothetical protein